MLRNNNASLLDKRVGGVSFQSFVIPAVGEFDNHIDGDVGIFESAAYAQQPGSITRLNFGVRISAHISYGDNSVFCDGVVGIIHFFEFETGCNTRKISAFVNISKRVVEIGKFGVVLSGRAGCVAEFHIGIFGSGFSQKRFVSERIGKHEFASVVGKVHGSGFACFLFGNVDLDNSLNSLCFTCSFESIDEVFVVSGVAVVQSDKPDFERDVISAARARGKAETTGNRRSNGKQNCQQFFHYKKYLRTLPGFITA